ncbi:MAG TPA: 3'-5' exonuclease [Gammaproteobacteria bacterium]|nr:3'-5' exonuclease [Gammaproteobacteria bacterium]
MNTLVFDIETVPDVELGRSVFSLDDLTDADVAKVMRFKQKQVRGTDFLPLPQHRIVAISVVLRSDDDLHVFSVGDADSGEPELVQRFFDGLDRYVPELVSWNGSGFDLPVLHYRAMRHSITAQKYWDVGDDNREFRFNNYLGRFHWRHIDLMDVIAGYQMGARSSLEQVALLLGFPGKLGMSGARVWDKYQEGRIEDIRNYCETDVLNTYLVYLRFQLMRGVLDQKRHANELARLRDKLAAAQETHLQEFLAAWDAD